jgi:hypothetical protein
MSEYQYYEFQAIDQPLNSEQLAYLRTLSRRVELSTRKAVYTYTFGGDLPTNPERVLAEHFDALLYVANWGSRRLAFRFPHNALDPDELKAYFAFDEISLTSSGQYQILNIEFNEEEGGDWIEGNGLLDSMIALRDDILRGDIRALYLVWLKAAVLYEDTLYEDTYEDMEYGEVDFEDELEEDDLEEKWSEGDPDLIEPPLPPGLGELSPALNALVEFFEIDSNLIAAAAATSPARTISNEPYEEWMKLMPAAERDAFLIRMARGEPRVAIDLLTRLRQLGHAASDVDSTARPRRAFAELKAAAHEHELRHIQQQQEEANLARLAKLEKLAKRETEAWQEVAQHLAKRRGSSYDSAAVLLVELHELATHRDQLELFAQRLGKIAGPYLSSVPLQQRLRARGLL